MCGFSRSGFLKDGANLAGVPGVLRQDQFFLLTPRMNARAIMTNESDPIIGDFVLVGTNSISGRYLAGKAAAWVAYSVRAALAIAILLLRLLFNSTDCQFKRAERCL